MSGIYGMVNAAGRIPSEALLSMQAALAHRGTTSLSAHTAYAALGQVSTRPTLQALLTNEAQTITLSIEGSITNYRELREDLLGLGHSFATRHAAEVVVHLYEEYGADMLTFLRGPFALALWDQRETRLLLACDPMSQTSLTYAVEGESLVFASEAEALFVQPTIARTSVFADPTVLAQALMQGALPPARTAFEGVAVLPAGHGLLWSVGAAEPQVFCYWQPPALAPANAKASIVEYEDAVQEHLANSVRLHVASAESVGVLLSGGLNSSLVAAMMQQQNRVLRTFTIRFGEADTPETQRAAEIAETLGAVHTALTLPMPDLSRVLPRLVWHTGQALITPPLLLMALLTEAVRGQADTVLTGVGGTILFGNPFAEASQPRVRPMWQAAATFLQRTRAARQREAQRQANDLMLLPPPTVEALTGVLPHTAHPAPSLLERMTEMATGLPYSHFAPLAQVSAAQGVDLRFPFADTHVVAAAAGIPLNLKHRPGKPLYVLQEAAQGLLPAPLVQPLTAETPPLADWLREQQSFVRKILLSKKAQSRGLLRTEAVVSLLDAHVSGHDHSAALLALLSLELWHRLFIDPAAPTAP